MQWILVFGNGIEVSRDELESRRKFIHSVTCATVSPWQPVIQDGQILPLRALTCESSDDIDALFITGHVNDLHYLFPLIDRKKPKIIILNACALSSALPGRILAILQRIVPNISLYYAHQQRDLAVQYVNLSYEGNFGFQTSLSERTLFRHRRKGLIESLPLAFDHITL